MRLVFLSNLLTPVIFGHHCVNNASEVKVL